jgi:hypothetical protein
MEPSEAEVFLEALNQNRDGAGFKEETAPYVAVLKKRIRAVRFEKITLKAELEAARQQIAILDRLLKDVQAARSYRMVHWLHGRLSGLAGLFRSRRGRRPVAAGEGRCDNGLPDSQGGDDPTRPAGPAVLPGE